MASERQELNTIDTIDYEILNWCPSVGGPYSARLLFDEDFVSKVLWSPFDDYTKGAGAMSAAKIDCEDEVVATRRMVARSKLAQYQHLVDEIVNTAVQAHDMLSSKVKVNALTVPSSTQGESPDVYVTLVLQNTGRSDSDPVATSEIYLSSGEHGCEAIKATAVALDPYSHQPQKKFPLLHIS